MAGEDDVSPENSANLPALRPQGTELSVVRPGSKLISRIAGDAYRHLPSLTEKLWRVGDYEVNEQSYRQIMIWLEQLKADGCEMTLNDFVENQDEDWISEFSIEKVYFCSRGYGFSTDTTLLDMQINAGDLLDSGELWISQIDLSHVPRLQELRCDFGEINALDLSRVPKLKKLSCFDNLLIELDLSHVSSLTELSCGSNQLMTLNLSHVPKLIKLRCDHNQITELDLSKVPYLTKLICGHNKINNLDLSFVPELTALECYGGQLLELDVRDCRTSEFRLACDPEVVVRHRPDQTVVRTSEK